VKVIKSRINNMDNLNKERKSYNEWWEKRYPERFFLFIASGYKGAWSNKRNTEKKVGCWLIQLLRFQLPNIIFLFTPTKQYAHAMPCHAMPCHAKCHLGWQPCYKKPNPILYAYVNFLLKMLCCRRLAVLLTKSLKRISIRDVIGMDVNVNVNGKRLHFLSCTHYLTLTTFGVVGTQNKKLCVCSFPQESDWERGETLSQNHLRNNTFPSFCLDCVVSSMKCRWQNLSPQLVVIPFHFWSWWNTKA